MAKKIEVTDGTPELEPLEWQRLLGSALPDKYKKVLRILKGKDNEPVSTDAIREEIPEFQYGWRDRMNVPLKKLGYFLINPDHYHGVENAHIQIIRLHGKPDRPSPQ